MKQAFDIDEKQMIQFTNKLEQMNRFDMPLAVRTTLNDAAKDAKFNELVPAFNRQFIVRRPTFITSHTAYNQCRNTFDISQMESQMGVREGRKVSESLKTQEMGGTIPDRDLIQTTLARKGKDIRGTVQRRYYQNRVQPINRRPFTQFKEVIQAAFTHGKGSAFLYKRVLLQVTQLKKGLIKFVNLYSYEKGRSVEIEKSPFISVAGNMSAKKIPRLYKRNALRRMKKYANK